MANPAQTVDTVAFRAAIAPAVAQLRALARAVADVAPRHGHVPFAPSQAIAEVAAEAASFIGRTTWQNPIGDTHTFGGMTLFAARDYVATFATAIDSDPTPVYGHQVVARSALEASVISAWLSEAGISPEERVKRGLCEQLYNAMELKRLKIEKDAAQRVRDWKVVADAFGWTVKDDRGKPLVAGVKRPSIPDGIDSLLVGEGEWSIGRVQWSYLSAVSHVTWYGLRQAVGTPAGGTTLAPQAADIGVTSRSIATQAVCLLRALRKTADARFALMGWRDGQWGEADREARTYEEAQIRALAASS